MAKDKLLSNRVKRSQRDSNSDSDPEPELLKNNEWPRFLIISPTNDDQSLGKLSPFAIAKGIKGLAGDPKDVKVLQSGKILVECAKRQQSENLMKSRVFVNIPIQVSPHKTLNFCRGVVRSRDLRNCSEAEMVENLRDQNVVEAKRIHISRNGNRILTNTFILKFNVCKLPENIKAGFINIPVEPFVPNPLRCYNCQRFGHHKDKCQKVKVCARCGQENHDFSSCENPKQCANCKGDHSAHSKECVKWQQEREILKIKVQDNVSFQEAKKRVSSRGVTGPTAQSYAEKVRTPRVETKSVAVQTEITWPQRSKCIYLDGSEVRFDINHSEASTGTSGNLLSQKSHTGDKTKRQPSKAKLDNKEVTEKPLPPSPNKRQPSKAKQNREGKIPKGQRDPIQVFNKFGALDEDMEIEEANIKPLSPSRNGKNVVSSAEKQTESTNKEVNTKPKKGGGTTKQVSAKLAAKKLDKPPPKATKGPSRVPRLKRVEASPDVTHDLADSKTSSPRGHGSRSRSHSPILPPK
jgi:hypothetical protein